TFSAVLLGIFAGFALVLAAIGLYGVASYLVNQCTKEIGVRMALGAQRPDVLKLILGQGLVYTAVGIAIGLIGALVTTLVLSSLLYGIKPNDPVTIMGASLLLAGVALVASYIPARRATKIDPMVALRYE